MRRHGRRRFVALALVVGLATPAAGCAHGGQISNKQIAIGAGVVVAAGVVIYAMTRSSDNDSFGFTH